MKNVIKVIFSLFSLIPFNVLNAQEMQTIEIGRMTGELSGTALFAIQAALPAVIEKNIDFRDYNIGVSEGEKNIYVTFKYKIIQPENMEATGLRGSRGQKPTFAVVIAKVDFKILKAYFVK